MDLLAILLGLLVFLAAGDLLVGLLKPDLARVGAGRPGLALLLGPGVCAFLLFVLSLAGVPLGSFSARALALGTGLLWIVVALRRRAATRPEPTRANGLPGAVLLALLLLPVALGAALALAVPPFKDALSIWSLKALVIFADGTVRSDDFLAENRFLFHPNYPLAVPLAQVFLFGLRGEVLDHAAKIVLAMAHLGAGLTLYAFLRPRLAGRLPLVLAALWSLTPHFYRTDSAYTFAGSVPSGYADPLLAGLLCGACLLVGDWLANGKSGNAVGAAVCLGLAVFTKNEGLAMAAVVLAAAALGWLAKRVRRAGAPAALTALPALFALALLVTPWLAFRATLPARDENYPARARPEVIEQSAWRAPVVLVSAVEEGFAAGRQGMVWPLLLIFVLAYRRRLLEPDVLFLLTVLAGLALVYFTVFLVSPLKVVDQIRTAMPRTFFHLAGPAFALIGCLLARSPGTNEPG